MAKHDDIKDNQLVKSIYEETAASEYESRSLLSEQRSEADLAYTSEYTAGTQPNTGLSSILINAFQPAVDTLTTYISNIFTNGRRL